MHRPVVAVSMRVALLTPNRVSYSLLALLLGGFMLVAPAGWAAAFTFVDLTDNVVVSPASPRVTTNCILEDCTNVHVTAPAGLATIVNTTIVGPFYIAEADGLTVSDGLGVFINIGDPSYVLSFLSGEDNTGGPCGLTNICRFNEDGSPQLVGTVTWSDGTVDSWFVQSDTAARAVPEPTTGLLLATGLVGLAGVGWRRHRRK
jgi:hypothetical protein